MNEVGDEAAAEFDAWLAGIRREAAELAWDEGYIRAVRDSVFDMTPADNPYREGNE